MKNYLQDGDQPDLVAPYNLASGDGFLVGSIFAVAVVSAVTGQALAGATEGVYELKAKAADTFAQGDKLYWDNTAKELTSTPTSNKWVATALSPKGNGATVVAARLNGIAI